MYTVGLVPADHETELVVVVPAAVANDVAGNDNTESNSLSFIFDTTVPTVVVSATCFRYRTCFVPRCNASILF